MIEQSSMYIICAFVLNYYVVYYHNPAYCIVNLFAAIFYTGYSTVVQFALQGQ